MPDFLSIAIRGNAEIAAKLERLEPAAAAAGTESAAQLIADRFNRYATDAAYNYVPYSAVGGFYSEAQRRFVMASLSNGTMHVPYSRKAGDHFSRQGSGINSKVVSDRVSMFYSMADQGQARLQGMRGWGKVSEILDANNADIVRAFDLGVADAITNMNRGVSEQMSNVAP